MLDRAVANTGVRLQRVDRESVTEVSKQVYSRAGSFYKFVKFSCFADLQNKKKI